MNILVDSSIWSLAFRRNLPFAPEVIELQKLIEVGQVEIIGPIRQEILSGVKTEEQFNKLQKHLQAFQDISITTSGYELAAKYFNLCRKQGIQGSNIDFLICAVAVQNNLLIFTTDKDFVLYQQFIPIQFYEY
jgi:predicted nucleic acid-binding protein